MRRVLLLHFALTLAACSLRDTPELGKGGAGGGASLTECEGDLVDLLLNPDHCGACNNACGTNTCFQGSCQTVLATDGAWGLAIDGGNLYWTHADLGPIERLSGTNQTESTVTTPANLYWDIQAKGSVVVVAPVDELTLEQQPPLLFSWGAPPSTPLCGTNPCQAAYDIASDNTIFAWGAIDGVWYYDAGQVLPFGVDPTAAVAYSRTAPYPKAVVLPVMGGPSKLWVAPTLDASTYTQLDATPAGLPTPMVFFEQTLFWIEDDKAAPFRVRCADVSAPEIVPIDYAKLPAGTGDFTAPSTLWVSPEASTGDDWLYVAFAGGTIGRAKRTCEPHDSLEILFELSQDELSGEAAWFIGAIRTNDTPDAPLHFTVSAPPVETAHGGLYTRHAKAPPLRSLQLEL